MTYIGVPNAKSTVPTWVRCRLPVHNGSQPDAGNSASNAVPQPSANVSRETPSESRSVSSTDPKEVTAFSEASISVATQTS